MACQNIIQKLNTKAKDVIEKYLGPNSLIPNKRRKLNKNFTSRTSSQRTIIDLTRAMLDKTYDVPGPNVTLNIVENIYLFDIDPLLYGEGIIRGRYDGLIINFMDNSIVADGSIARGIVIGVEEEFRTSFQIMNGTFSGLNSISVFATNIDDMRVNNMTFSDNITTDQYAGELLTGPFLFNCTDLLVDNTKIKTTISTALKRSVMVSPIVLFNCVGTVNNLQVTDGASDFGECVGFFSTSFDPDLLGPTITNTSVVGITATDGVMGMVVVTPPGTPVFNPRLDGNQIVNLLSSGNNTVATGIAVNAMKNASIFNTTVTMVRNNTSIDEEDPVLAAALDVGDSSVNFIVDSSFIITEYTTSNKSKKKA
ncbi:MAG: hypothetical protein Harvfovirus2_40 [Harvfovirus sp.]|uniref:Uncharacterized protein n=1 Tax=Harvfovirus sp. TaxID=2487768 RepID=A0A3G5A060_9VIRU|nr:MAG: hypothetical protein Harvfovirus2_40 [Harvfovirus sp.]